jgi:hypothetical protein
VKLESNFYLNYYVDLLCLQKFILWKWTNDCLEINNKLWFGDVLFIRLLPFLIVAADSRQVQVINMIASTLFGYWLTAIFIGKEK